MQAEHSAGCRRDAGSVSDSAGAPRRWRVLPQHLGCHRRANTRRTVDQLVDLADHDDRRPPHDRLVFASAAYRDGLGGMPIPAEVDEGTFLGTLYGEPVEVVKCETNDLEVPAGAEVVIEGHVSIT